MSELPHPNVSDVRKRCCRCGKDLTGHTRFKNSQGYWCRNCSAEDELRKARLGRGKRSSGGISMTLIGLGVILVLVVLYLYAW